MRWPSVASMCTSLGWPAIFTRDHYSLQFGLDIHISAAAGTQEPKCLKLSAGREEEGDEVEHPVQSLAGRIYRRHSALRPRHVGIQNVDTKDYPANQTHSFAVPQPCPALYLRSRTVLFFPQRPRLSSHLLLHHQAPRQIPSSRRLLPLETSPGTLRRWR